MAAPKIETVAIIIGLAPNVAASEASAFNTAHVASPSPRYRKRDPQTSDAEWSDYCTGIREAAESAESPAIAAALHAIRTDTKGVTVMAVTAAFGTMGNDGRYVAYPTIADAEGWRQVGLMARARGCTIITL